MVTPPDHREPELEPEPGSAAACIRDLATSRGLFSTAAVDPAASPSKKSRTALLPPAVGGSTAFPRPSSPKKPPFQTICLSA